MNSNKFICLILVLISVVFASGQFSQDKSKLDRLLDPSAITNLDTLEIKFVSRGIRDVCTYLKNEDEDKFNDVISKSKTVNDIIPNVMKIYEIDLVELATEYFKRTREKAPFKSRYKMSESAHFRFFYPQNFFEDEIAFIMKESEAVFDSLENVFKPDSSLETNLDILYTYRDWDKSGFSKRTGDLTSANRKFQMVLVNSVEEVNKIYGTNSGTQIACTSFGTDFTKDGKYVTTMISAVAYKSPISLIEIIHEITHSYVYTLFSKPQIVQEYIDEHPDARKPGKIPEMVFLNAFSRTSILTIEGVAVWAGFNFSPYQRCGFLPDARYIVNPETSVKLEDLLSGNIDVSLFGAIFGKAPAAVGSFFLSSGSFMGFIADNWTSEQLMKLFNGSGEVVTEKEMENITGKKVKEIEKQWHEWMR